MTFSAGTGNGTVGSPVNQINLGLVDLDNTRNQVIIKITSLPAHGLLKLNGNELAVGSTFAVSDINKLEYQHTGGEVLSTTTDAFLITVDDGAGGLLGEAAGLKADGAGAEAAVVDDGGGFSDVVFVDVDIVRHAVGCFPSMRRALWPRRWICVTTPFAARDAQGTVSGDKTGCEIASNCRTVHASHAVQTAFDRSSRNGDGSARSGGHYRGPI